MSKTMIPKGYKAQLNLIETQVAIKELKDFFEKNLAHTLNLVRVSAPLFVNPQTGLNDDLSGVERPVSFDYKAGGEAQIIHSLAKWKRNALGEYGFALEQGLYTDMNAIRRDEDLDNIHSIYVDQWDWEKVIDASSRNVEYLREIVDKIYEVFLQTEQFVNSKYPYLERKLPDKIYFIDSQELENLYPGLSAKERERRIAEEKKAVFISRIGCTLESGKPHDNRAPDYDDWELNGDIIFYNPVLEDAIELSSMGIRVDDRSLLKQLRESNHEERLNLSYHKSVLENKIPLTVGGGIGQSRICMFFLQKAHIGEVHASLWDRHSMEVCKEAGVVLL